MNFNKITCILIYLLIIYECYGTRNENVPKRTKERVRKSNLGEQNLRNNNNNDRSNLKSSNNNLKYNIMSITTFINYESSGGVILPIRFAEIVGSVKCKSCIMISGGETKTNDVGECSLTFKIHFDDKPIKIKVAIDLYTNGKYISVSDSKSSKISNIKVYKITYVIEANPKDILYHEYKFLEKSHEDERLNFLIAYGFLTKLALESIKLLDMGEIIKLGVYASDGLETGLLKNANFLQLDYEDAGFPTILLHEYGHFIQRVIYNGKLNVATGKHDPCEIQTEELAWSEGYATAYGQIMGEILNLNSKGVFFTDKWYNEKEIEGVEGMYVEYYSCGYRTLYTDEGRVYAMLYDLYDSNDDI